MIDNGNRTTLHLLAASSTTAALDAARNLLKNGESACVKSDDGLTPLHVACAYDCLAMTQLLMHYGANPYAEDNSGRTPYSMATGNTQRFLQRILAKSTREQRGIIRRLFACHKMVREDANSPPFMKSIRRKIQRSFDEITRRPPLEAPLVTEASARLSVPNPSTQDQATFHSAIPVYPLVDRMPQPLLLKNLREPGKNSTLVQSNAQEIASPSFTLEQRVSSSSDPKQSTSQALHDENYVSRKTTNRSGISPEEKSANDLSGWLSEKDSTRDTQDTDVFLTANESFDFDLQKRMEQMRIGNPMLSPYVDDGQLRKVRRLNDEQLKAELKELGIIAGPMCARTRGVYEKKLVAMRREAAEVKGLRYSRQLEMAIMRMLSWESGRVLDDKVRQEFVLHGVNAFCYLLLDPRKIVKDAELLDLKGFVHSIFYVGKGSKARPLAHLIEAKKGKEAGSPKLVSNPKLQRINSIWESGRGVVCLQISQNISDDEAFVREAALIDAIRLENLTNMKAGEYRGKSKSWNLSMKAEFGTYQLERARGVLKMEGVRPIMPEALPESHFPYISKKT